MQIRVDHDELPNGYSAVVHIPDGDYSVSLGSGNTFAEQTKEIAIVDFKRFDVSILGGRSFRQYVMGKAEEYGGHHLAAVAYLLQRWGENVTKGSIAEFFALLHCVTNEAERNGRRKKAEELRRWLDTD